MKATQSKSRQCDRFRHEGETVESRYLIRYIYAAMEDHSLYLAKCSKGLVLVNQRKKSQVAVLLIIIRSAGWTGTWKALKT